MKTKEYNETISYLRTCQKALRSVKNGEEANFIVLLGKRFMENKNIKLSKYAKREYYLYLED